MDTTNNRVIEIAYDLYTVEEDGRHLVERASEETPYRFISGFGLTLETLEKAVEGLQVGSPFEVTLTKEQAYGDYEEERVLDLDREIFTINGHFDHEHIYKNAIVPLQNEEGMPLMGRVLEVGDKVKMDLNHPLAGTDLLFKGKVILNRQATEEEVQMLIKHLSGDPCGCGCDGCEDGCGHDHHDGCGHHHDHHHDGCGCGHCH